MDSATRNSESKREMIVQPLNYAIKFGEWTLSVQASRTHYSSPRKDGYALHECSAVEVGLWPEDGKFSCPSRAGIEGFDDLWENPDREDAGVAGYVPLQKVKDLILLLEAKHGPAMAGRWWELPKGI